MFIVKGRLIGTFLGLLIAALGVVQLSSAGSSTCEPPLPAAASTAAR